MASAKDQMKKLDEEIARVRSQMAKLQIEEAAFLRLKALQAGEGQQLDEPVQRKRAPSVKPHVLEVLHRAGQQGMTTAEVAEVVRAKVPQVGKDTVGSVLSRLKADGALSYSGERYFEKQFAPVEPHLRAVS